MTTGFILQNGMISPVEMFKRIKDFQTCTDCIIAEEFPTELLPKIA